VAHQTQTISKPQIHQKKFACESFALLEIFTTQTTPTFTPLPSLRYRSRPHVPTTLDKARNAPNSSFKTLEKLYWGKKKKKKAAAFGYGFAMTSKLKINNVHKIRPFAKFSHKTNPLTHSLTHSLPCLTSVTWHAKRELGFNSLLRCENLVPTLTLDSVLPLNNLFK
jgi:hypothetical protein